MAVAWTSYQRFSLAGILHFHSTLPRMFQFMVSKLDPLPHKPVLAQWERPCQTVTLLDSIYGFTSAVFRMDVWQ